MHRFIVAEHMEVGREYPLSKQEEQHALKTLRLKAGQEIEVFDGAGARFLAELLQGARVRVTEGLPSNEPPVELTLLQGLPKADKMEWIIQKATELGVSRVVPVKMARCVVKWDPKDEKRIERMRRIALEAAKQCGRGRVAEVTPPMPLAAALQQYAPTSLLMAPWEEATDGSLKEIHGLHESARRIALVIGPEGGMEAAEASLCQAAGGHLVTLGRRILRTETAALASIAVIMGLWGDLT